jgi:phosphoribosylformylglycinamidine (FGAM) synthase PurS component
MTPVFVRLLKRKTSVELDADSFLKTELTTKDGNLDLNLSVYQLDILLGESLVCTCSEHTAGNELDPEARTCVDVSKTAGWSSVKSPTQNKLFNFKFSSDAHHEIKFDEQGLRQFANQVVSWFQENSETMTNYRNVSKKEMCSYAYQNYLAEDAEWQEVCKLSEKVKKWVMKGRNML